MSSRKETWISHCCFGVTVGVRLLITSVIFVINGVLPFIPIPKALDLRNTANWAGKTSFTRRQERRRYARI